MTSPNFEWDELKRQRTRAERQIDFAELGVLWDGRPVLGRPDERHAQEPRYVRVGRIKGRLFVVVWTPRAASVRLISARKANTREEREVARLSPDV